MTGEISLQDIFSMGISPRMVWKILGPPLRSRTRIPFPRDPQHHFYLRAALEEKTRGREYQRIRLIETLRELQAGEGRLKAALEQARQARLVTRFPDLDWDRIVRVARESKLQHFGPLFQQPRMSAGVLVFCPEHAGLAETLDRQLMGQVTQVIESALRTAASP